MIRWKKTAPLHRIPSLNLAARMTQYLPVHTCTALAQRVGFQQRRPRKVKPAVLLQALCAQAFGARSSLEMLASVVGLLGGQPVSKQAVAQRFSAHCVEFLRHALFAVLGAVVDLPRLVEAGVFEPFARVLIQDSTHLQLHRRLAGVFPGSRNQSGRKQAIVKIQTIYDLLRERFVSFALDSYRRNDQAASVDILEVARPGDLVLRDLGYFGRRVLRKLQQNGVFFLSRMHHRVSLWTEKGQRFDLLGTLRTQGKLDTFLQMGTEEKALIRLVALPVSQEQANARRRMAKQNRDQRHRPKKEHLELLGWAIFITNVPPSVWSPQTLCRVYGLRWRIEIVFKSWKSHFHITHLPSGSAHQVQILLYARLIFIAIFQTCFGLVSQYFQNTYDRSISLLKLSQFLAEHHTLIAPLTTSSEGLELTEKLIAQHCCYTKRRNRLNYREALQCLS